ncbi:MAG: hypothetical protein KKH68_01750, partial [Proteobacteria bacterium]|nr:hypothetical protein [Pseudomonadota bacterium]
MTDKIFFRPVIPLLIALIAGIGSGAWLPGHKVLATAVIFVGAVIILIGIIKKKIALFSPVVLFAVLGYLSIQPWLVPEFLPQHVIHFQDSHPWEIVGTIDDNPFAPAKDRLRFI